MAVIKGKICYYYIIISAENDWIIVIIFESGWVPDALKLII